MIKFRQHSPCLGSLCCISIVRDDFNYDLSFGVGLVIVGKRVSLIQHLARLTRVPMASREWEREGYDGYSRSMVDPPQASH
ncbi:MAG TPA: hypothetical protein VKT81_16575 [Bryobacteraceae bacterium]|nr:hypothetical protein [Bryobacteraceae bacterium]